MKNCVICKRKINGGEVCESCFYFLKWKYKKKWKGKINEFKELGKKQAQLNSGGKNETKNI
jgi:hypothetical protein